MRRGTEGWPRAGEHGIAGSRCLMQVDDAGLKLYQIPAWNRGATGWQILGFSGTPVCASERVSMKDTPIFGLVNHYPDGVVDCLSEPCVLCGSLTQFGIAAAPTLVPRHLISAFTSFWGSQWDRPVGSLVVRDCRHFSSDRCAVFWLYMLTLPLAVMLVLFVKEIEVNGLNLLRSFGNRSSLYWWPSTDALTLPIGLSGICFLIEVVFLEQAGHHQDGSQGIRGVHPFCACFGSSSARLLFSFCAMLFVSEKRIGRFFRRNASS